MRKKILTSSLSEITNTVFSMDPYSSLGPDGFAGYFYQTCQDFIKGDVINFIVQFFTTVQLYQNVNCSFISAIPKVEGANSITQFRPKDMINFRFKIITKTLANRLGSIDNRVISAQQAAFIKGCQISDCIGMVSEAINILFGANVAIKLDIVKAFDTLD